jgi:hypothetical protein
MLEVTSPAAFHTAAAEEVVKEEAGKEARP